jgi:AraC-like DNA-binding protein
MDPIADIFKTMQVEAVVQARLEATAPWALLHRPAEADTGKDHKLPVLPSELAYFGMVARGNCWLSVNGIPNPAPLTGGDCFLVAPRNAYRIGDDPRTPAKSFCEVAPHSRSSVMHYGGGGAPTTIVSGWLSFAKPTLKPMSQLLPRVILIKSDQARSLALHTTLQMLASEMSEQAPGSEVVANRLAEVLFIQAIRAHIASGGESCRPGWLRAIFDGQIGAALKSIHEDVGRSWTVESLAESAGMSRSAFAARFKELLGQAPLEYLTEWRMQKAVELLRHADKKLFEIARSVGYESDAAFSKAFKRVIGSTPGEYRQGEETVRELTRPSEATPAD